MSRTVHLCISVRGMLNWDRRETRRNMKNITRADGQPFESVEAFRQSLMDALAAGHEVLPIGEMCEGFDFKGGCPGHEEQP